LPYELSNTLITHSTYSQLKNWKKLVKEMKQSVAEMYKRKVLKDAYYINYKGIIEEAI
jgi:hypothetical protein